MDQTIYQYLKLCLPAICQEKLTSPCKLLCGKSKHNRSFAMHYIRISFKRNPLAYILIKKNQQDVLISQIYFSNRTLNVLDSFSVHYQGSSTVHTAIHNGYADCLLASSLHNLYDIYLLLCVQFWTPDDGHRNCPKHEEFYSKINLRNQCISLVLL